MRWSERLLCVSGLLLAVTGLSVSAMAREAASILIDYRTGAVLDADNADDAVIPASLTKMMTLYLTFRSLEAGQLDLSSRLPVSARASAMPPTKLGLQPGDTIRVEDAILGLVTRSANDAAAVLAEGLGGTEDRFALAMTRTARKLGMTRTVFRNASGLPNDEQRTTARDLALLASHLISDFPGYYRYFSSPNFVYRGRNHPNHNRLLGVYPGMDGLKTGYTQASGFNLAASAVRGGRRLVAVVIGGRSTGSRDAQMVALLDRGFAMSGRPRGADVLVAQKPARHGRASASRAEAAPLETETVVASLETTASDAVATVPSARPKHSAKSVDAPPRSAKAKSAKAKSAKANTISTKSRRRADPVAAEASTASASYGVQVGAFRAAPQARAALGRAIDSAPSLLDGASPGVTVQTVGKKRIYRASLAGLSRSDADAACGKLKKKKLDCIVVPVAAENVASR